MVRVPVAFQYIITNIQGQLNLTNASPPPPMEAFELIEEYYTKLETIGFMTTLFKILLLLPDPERFNHQTPFPKKRTYFPAGNHV
jgi:hypothetical protein